MQNKSGKKRIEDDLARARAAIHKAVRTKKSNYTSDDDDGSFIPRGSIYRNAYAFHQLSFQRYRLIWFRLFYAFFFFFYELRLFYAKTLVLIPSNNLPKLKRQSGFGNNPET